MRLSRRSAFDPTPNALSVALAKRRAAKLPLLDLAASNPTTAGLPYDGDAIRAALADAHALVYEPEPFGLRSAREAVARDALAEDGEHVDADDVMLTASTSEAYALVTAVLADPGDALLVPAPSYPLLAHLGALSGVELVPYPLVWDGAWRIDAHALRGAITERTRGVVVVSPNNPTGSYLHADDDALLASLGLPVIGDEVFRRYPLSPRTASPRAPHALSFALSGLSKLALLPQLKLAWTVVRGDARRDALARLELAADTFLSPSAPVMHALPALLRATRPTVAALRMRLATNLAALRAALDTSSPITLLAPEGGWYAVLRLPATRSEEQWCLGLLDDGVHVQPGHFFDFASEAYVVVSLLPREAELAEGVARLVAHVATHA